MSLISPSLMKPPLPAPGESLFLYGLASYVFAENMALDTLSLQSLLQVTIEPAINISNNGTKRLLPNPLIPPLPPKSGRLKIVVLPKVRTR
ncbi:FKBP12-rapamycin complex-associated protein [Fusarium oxysporum f. sp. albedinis]|nr:FKBP12-rapamycin complex-associated protein [Fusarium oxysporum f. sp. albedinis]